MGASASKVLDHDVNAAWFEGDTIVAIVDAGVLDDNVVAVQCAARNTSVYELDWRCKAKPTPSHRCSYSCH
jgi:hypothetical protein